MQGRNAGKLTLTLVVVTKSLTESDRVYPPADPSARVEVE